MPKCYFAYANILFNPFLSNFVDFLVNSSQILTLGSSSDWLLLLNIAFHVFWCHRLLRYENWLATFAFYFLTANKTSLKIHESDCECHFLHFKTSKEFEVLWGQSNVQYSVLLRLCPSCLVMQFRASLDLSIYILIVLYPIKIFDFSLWYHPLAFYIFGSSHYLLNW